MMVQSEKKSSQNVPPIPDALKPDDITVLAFGSLLSEPSSRLTFPELRNFRHVRVRGFRRVFAHPHLFLLEQGLVNHLHMASLSAERTTSVDSHDHSSGTDGASSSSFVVAAFEVSLNDEQRYAFMERESSYEIASVPYFGIDMSESQQLGTGVICLKGNDEDSADLIETLPSSLPYRSIWNWPKDSGLLPADIYLRHCLLAVEKSGNVPKESFWKETMLADRTTTLAEYLRKPQVYGRVMAGRPPEHLATRFGG